MTLKTTIAFLCLFALPHVCSGHVCTGDQEFLAEEDDPLTLSCEVAANSTSLSWYWSSHGKDFDLLDFCFLWNGSCALKLPKKDEDHRLDNNKLIIKLNLFSRVAGRVKCTSIRTDFSVPTQYCRIRVKYPADKIQNCTVQRNFTDVSLSGSCDAEKINSSDDEALYRCQWKHRVGNQTVWNDTRAAETLADGGRIRCGFHGYHVNASHESGDLTLWIDRGRGWYYVASLPFSGLHSATDSTTNAVTDTIAVTDTLAVTDTIAVTDTEDANSDSTPLAVTAAVIAVIVLIIIVVVVVVVAIAVIVKRRKGSEKRMTTAMTRSTRDRDNDVVVEFINDFYGDVEQSQPPNLVPAPANAPGFSSNENEAAASSSPLGDEAADLQSPPPTSHDRAATNQNADTGLYSAEDQGYSMCYLQGSGTPPPTLNLPADSSKPSPGREPKSKKTNRQAMDPKPRPETHQTPDLDQSHGENARTQGAPAKRRKRAGHKITEAEGEACAQVRKLKSAATKPKKKVTGAGTTEASASAHPSVCVRPEATAPAYENVSSSDQGTQPKEVTSTADCDDEYCALDFHRRPVNESARTQEALYSHTCTTAVQKKS